MFRLSRFHKYLSISISSRVGGRRLPHSPPAALQNTNNPPNHQTPTFDIPSLNPQPSAPSSKAGAGAANSGGTANTPTALQNTNNPPNHQNPTFNTPSLNPQPAPSSKAGAGTANSGITTNTPAAHQNTKNANHQTPALNTQSPNPQRSSSTSSNAGAATYSNTGVIANNPRENQSPKPNPLLKYLKHVLYVSSALLSIGITIRTFAKEAEQKKEALKREDHEMRVENQLENLEESTQQMHKEMQGVLKKREDHEMRVENQLLNLEESNQQMQKEMQGVKQILDKMHKQ